MKIIDIITEASGRYDDFGRSDFRAYDEPDQRSNWVVKVGGKKWKVFANEKTARKAAYTVQQKYGKDTEVYATMDPVSEDMGESATAGATSAGNIASVEAPHLSPGSARGKTSYTGKPGGPSGTKAPPQPKVKQPKKKDGTAVNALDMTTSLFGKGSIKR